MLKPRDTLPSKPNTSYSIPDVCWFGITWRYDWITTNYSMIFVVEGWYQHYTPGPKKTTHPCLPRIILLWSPNIKPTKKTWCKYPSLFTINPYFFSSLYIFSNIISMGCLSNCYQTGWTFVAHPVTPTLIGLRDPLGSKLAREGDLPTEMGFPWGKSLET